MNDKISKESVLQSLSAALTNGVVTKDQVLQVLSTESVQPISHMKISLQKVLYYIGGFILLLGIMFYIGQFWGQLDAFPRVLITLGGATAAYLFGYYFTRQNRDLDLRNAFFLIAIVLFPLGFNSALNAVGFQSLETTTLMLISAMLFILYVVSLVFLRVELFLPFVIIAATSFFITFTNYLVTSTYIPRFNEYRMLVIGVSYLFLGYYFSMTKKNYVTNLLYFSGLFLVLVTGLVLQNFKPNMNMVWESLYPPLLGLTFYLSVKLQRAVFLVMGTIFTFIMILKFTYEYFSGSVGWPVSLIIAGALMMGIGFMSFELKKRYFKKV